MTDKTDNDLIFLGYHNENMTDANGISALEALLRFTEPAQSAKKHSTALYKACGSLAAVFDAPYNILTDQGLSMSQAILIKLVPAMTRRYLDDKFFSKNSPSKIRDFQRKLIAAFISSRSEQVLLVLRDKYDTELYFGIISKGSVNASEIYIKKILELALRYKASSAIIAHNHPSGLAYPSQLDSQSTLVIKNALSNLDIRLTNHYIIAANQVFSMADSAEFYDLFL